MSTYWGYRCQTCSADSEEWFNHGDQDLIEIYQQWANLKPVFKAIETANWRLGIEVRGPGPEIIAFLTEHDGHAVVLHNEYGDVKAMEPS